MATKALFFFCANIIHSSVLFTSLSVAEIGPLSALIHILHYTVCLTETKSTMTCLFWGDTLPITAHSASFLAIT